MLNAAEHGTQSGRKRQTARDRVLRPAALFLALSVAAHALAADSPSSPRYRYSCPPPPDAEAYWIATKNYLDELDPAAVYPRASALHIFATLGEYEPLTFVIYAKTVLAGVRIKAGDLRCAEATIPRSSLDIPVVVRAPRRETYTSPPEDHRVVSRFLPLIRKPLAIAAGHCREIWITVHVPTDAEPGEYKGTITVAPANADPVNIPLAVTVLPFRLPDIPQKRYGVYHTVDPNAADIDKVKCELTDIRRHGGTLIYPHLDIVFTKDADGRISVSYDRIRKGLPLLIDAGFQNPFLIGTGFAGLQRLLRRKHEELESSDAFRSHAREAVEGLRGVIKDFPDVEIALTHLDEVFNRNRLPRYIAFTKAAQQVPGFRYYITFHTVSDRADAQRKEIDPYVDIRGHHGYSFEWWLARGHTVAEYEEELRKSGDEAWFYLNPNRIWRDAKYQRLMNGLYMWITPFSGRLDWGYTHPIGDPFDDLDGKSTDTGYVFWSTDDPPKLVPTRDWEAWREGIDDMKYLLMLQSLIDNRKGSRDAQAAARWLGEMRSRIPKPQGLDYSSGPTPQRDASESPYILAMRKALSSDDLQKIRHGAAQHITALLETKEK